MSKKAQSPVNSGANPEDNNKTAKDFDDIDDDALKNQHKSNEKRLSSGAHETSGNKNINSLFEQERNNTQNAQRGTSLDNAPAPEDVAHPAKFTDQVDDFGDGDKNMIEQSGRNNGPLKEVLDVDDEHQHIANQQSIQDPNQLAEQARQNDDGVNSNYGESNKQDEQIGDQLEQQNSNRNSPNNQKGSSSQNIDDPKNEQQVTEIEPLACANYEQQKEEEEDDEDDDNYSAEDGEENDVFDNQDQNQHFYKEYCRLYYANIILTNRLQQLLDEKQDLGYKLNRLESNKRNHEIVLNMPFEIDNEKKKRHRRTATEIARHYKCPIEDCPKSYGSEGSLNQHIKLKHPEYYAEVIQQSNANQSMQELVDMTEWQGN